MPVDDPARPIDDEQRQAAITDLRQAAEDGRLGPRELDERLARVHAARLAGELGAALAGIRPSAAAGSTGTHTWPVAAPQAVPPPPQQTPPGQPAPQSRIPDPPGYRPDDRLNLSGNMSNEKRSGRWVIPPFMRAHATFSNVKLDCRDASPAAEVIDVEIGMGASTIVLVLPPGWAVNTDRLGKGMGTIKVKVPNIAAPGCPTFVLHGNVGMGTVVAREANWLERRRSGA